MGRNYFDVGKSITRALERKGPENCDVFLKSRAPSTILKNRYIGNVMYMTFARCHYRAQKGVSEVFRKNKKGVCYHPR
jgi:hypothetical protein